MPDIKLNIPKNSKFQSSLNEIDMAFKEILLNQMRIADPRDRSGNPNSKGKDGDWLWESDRVFQVDDLDTIEIFNTWLLRNKRKLTEIQYPICAFKQEDIDTVFWGTGNRYAQWEFDMGTKDAPIYHEGAEVIILAPINFRGLHATIADTVIEGLRYTVKINGDYLRDIQTKKPIEFSIDNLKLVNLSGEPKKYKAKAITGTYNTVILAPTRDEIQYIRDKFMLRCADGQIWHVWESPILEGTESQLFTVFGIPNIDRYPSSDDKLQQRGYIYGTSFSTNIWGAITDGPIPSGIIETIRENITVEKKTNRIIING